MKKTEKIAFLPGYALNAINKSVYQINAGLRTLQEYVTAHGEAWQDVLTYIERGALYQIEAREAECKKWLDETHAPAYIRGDALAKAVADLGADNLAYWRGLPSVLRVSDSPLGDGIDLRKYADVSGDVWRVSDAWRQEQIDNMTIHVPEWMAADMSVLETALRSLLQLRKAGYDIHYFADSVQQVEDFGEIDAEIFFNSYNPEADTIHPELAKASNIE